MINRCYQWDLVQSCGLPNGQTWRRELAGAPCGRNPDWWRREWWCPWHDWIDLCSNCPPPGRGHLLRYWRTAGARLSPFLDCSWPQICQQINTRKSCQIFMHVYMFSKDWLKSGMMLSPGVYSFDQHLQASHGDVDVMAKRCDLCSQCGSQLTEQTKTNIKHAYRYSTDTIEDLLLHHHSF